MKHSFKTGLSFGLTSGIITVLGLLVGLHSSTHSKMVVLGGILIIAIADALSDALGIHVSEESENIHTSKEIWESTIATLSSKFFISLTFVLPLVFFSLEIAVIVCIFWGLFLLSFLSFMIARKQKSKPWLVVAEHLIIALVVIAATYYLGRWINAIFM
jgi:VIT1/CCC1 family predicted Fe2+/Mn2+ transporter